MDLTQALTELANFYNLNPAHLIGYADEDNIGGFHFDETKRTYHTGSIWGVEGQVLYALIRAMKPDRVANLGTGVGCSLHHMAAACFGNGSGMVYSVDNNSGEEIRYLDKSRTERLKAHIHFETADMVQWLEDQPDNSYDLIFEDWSHDPVAIAEVWRLAQRKLKPGGLMISHDSEHFLVGTQVLEGVVNSHVPPFGILRQLIEPADTGMIYWQRDYGGVDRPEVRREVELEPIPEENQLPEFDADDPDEWDGHSWEDSDIIDYEAELTDDDIEQVEIDPRSELEAKTKTALLKDYDGDEYGLKSSMTKGEIVDTILDKWSEWNEDNEPE